MISTSISTALIQKLSSQQAWHYMILPYEATKEGLAFYISDDQDYASAKVELELIMGCEVELQPTASAIIKKAISKYYRKSKFDSKINNRELFNDIRKSVDLNRLIEESKNMGSSDIHIEIYEEKCRIRMRIDGKLIERYILSREEYPSLVNKIKIQANLDIAEKRLPQDGRILYRNTTGQKTDLRVSVLPTLHGEKIVLRLLNNDTKKIQLEEVGFSKNNLNTYLEGVNRPNGIVLISGPTGSGKTTTLYATLQKLNKTSRNIVTIEDPIEYTMEGINQVQLKENIGLDFPSAMRTFLRQDPDIIMVGEIRDKATAEMAIRASLTGHLVLSTIHTNSAWGIVARLIDMGIPSYLLADTLNTAVAQRLVRMLCKDCKVINPITPQSFPAQYKLPEDLTECYHPTGCENCYFTGYKGRTAIYEVIPITRSLSDCIKEGQLNFQSLSESKSLNTLSDHAFELLKNGTSSLEEVYPILATS